MLFVAAVRNRRPAWGRPYAGAVTFLRALVMLLRRPWLPSPVPRQGDVTGQRRRLPGRPRQPRPVQPGAEHRPQADRRRLGRRAAALQHRRTLRRHAVGPLAAPEGHRRQPVGPACRHARCRRAHHAGRHRPRVLPGRPPRLLGEPLHPRRLLSGAPARRRTGASRQWQRRGADVRVGRLLPRGRAGRCRQRARAGRPRRPRRCGWGALRRLGGPATALHRT